MENGAYLTYASRIDTNQLVILQTYPNVGTYTHQIDTSNLHSKQFSTDLLLIGTFARSIVVKLITRMPSRKPWDR